MPLLFSREDITRIPCDAIVTPANSFLSGGSRTDNHIREAAGADAVAHCASLSPVEYGCAVATPGGALPCRLLIHAVTPRWYHGLQHEEDLLASCYTQALTLARRENCERVALPLLAPQSFYGISSDREFLLALKAMRPFFEDGGMTVILATDSTPVDAADRRNISSLLRSLVVPEKRRITCSMQKMPDEAPLCAEEPAGVPADLTDALKHLDEGFSGLLMELIDRKGLTDAACYKRANIDRKLFSKIRSNPAYRPSKPTVLAFAVALELSLAETEELLKRAGFAFSSGSSFDCIVSYYIGKREYNVMKINETLFAFDQSLLG